MKKIASLLVAAGLVLGSAISASAIDFGAAGSFEMGYYWADHTHFTDEQQDKFGAATRIQLQLNAIANENLRGTYIMRVGTISWGVNNGNGTGPTSGYGIGTQGVNVRTLEGYLAFRWPETNLKFRMGLFPMRLPQAVKGRYTGSMIMDERTAGLEAVYEFNSNVSVVAHWSRLANLGDGIVNQANRESKLDVIMLAVPVKTDIINVTPWGMFGMAGKNATYSTGSPRNPYHASSALYSPTGVNTMDHVVGKDGKLWWAGLAMDVTALDNWILKADVIYGSYRADYTNGDIQPGGRANAFTSMTGRTDDPKREGWLFDAQIGYKFDYFTPTLTAFYSSGDDYDDWKRNKSGRIPVLSNLGGWTSLGGMNSIAATSDGIDRKLLNAQGYTGMWGVMFALEDIKFIEKLTSCFRVLYLRGTNDNDILRNNRDQAISPWYLGTSDSAWEFNFNHEYKLYENLGFWVELGYIILDRKHSNEPTRHEWQSKNATSIFTGFYYKF